MLSFFSKKFIFSNNHILVLDIGTSKVKALILELHPDNPSKGSVIGFGSHNQRLGDMQSGVVTDIYGVIQNCKKAISDAERMANLRSNKMIMGIAGELVKGVTTKVSYTRTDPEEKITIDELKNIIHKIQWKTFDSVRSQLARETGYQEIDVKLINASIVSVGIDGYKVTNPIGFQGKEMMVDIFNAFAPLTHYGALQTIAAELHKDLIAIAAEPYAVSRCIDYEEGGKMGGIFIDIGGGTTDIALVQDGTLMGTKMFTIGGRIFTKRLAQSLNVSFQEAEAVKLSYSNNTLEKNSSKIVKESMESDAEVWLSGVILTLNEFENVEVLPSRILLCGGGSLLPEIKSILENSNWYKKLAFARKPQVSFLTPDLISRIEDKTSLISSQEHITPVALANMAIQMNEGEKVISKILRKVVNLMQA